MQRTSRKQRYITDILLDVNAYICRISLDYVCVLLGTWTELATEARRKTTAFFGAALHCFVVLHRPPGGRSKVHCRLKKRSVGMYLSGNENYHYWLSIYVNFVKIHYCTQLHHTYFYINTHQADSTFWPWALYWELGGQGRW